MFFLGGLCVNSEHKEANIALARLDRGEHGDKLESLIAETKKATSEQRPFSESGLDSAILSIKNLVGSRRISQIDWLALQKDS